jgi:hypothetical protein
MALVLCHKARATQGTLTNKKKLCHTMMNNRPCLLAHLRTITSHSFLVALSWPWQAAGSIFIPLLDPFFGSGTQQQAQACVNLPPTAGFQGS